MDKKMIAEYWVAVPGFEGLYEISNHSNIRSLDRITVSSKGVNRKFKGITRARTLYNNGYYAARICKNGTVKTAFIHRLMAEIFIPNPENKPQVNHINGVKTDNRIENLEWVTCQENIQHAYDTGLTILPTGSDHHHAKPVLQFDKSYNLIKRYCSVTEAGKELGILRRGIYGVCSGDFKSAGGFIWKYEEDLTAYEIFQLKTFGNIIPETDPIEPEEDNWFERQMEINELENQQS